MRVLGVDPGLQCTGYGVVEYEKGRSGIQPKLVLIEAGVIHTRAKDKLPVRLHKIFQGIQQVLEEYHPQVMALEELYSHYQNPRTAIMMAHARGVICQAAAGVGIKVIGYAARRVKKAITGTGAARKPQMQKVIREILGLNTLPSPSDVADALALAITHLHVLRMQR